jgi:tripartite-type tricarboxylate transporter receptor subunit TctC
MLITRRSLTAGLATCAFAGRGTAFARDYPIRNVTVVVPYPPGGTVGLMARIIAERVGADLGAIFVVENKGGGAGAIGTLAVARAEADGYTLVLGTQQTHATNPTLLANLAYDPVRDFIPIAQVCALQHLLVVPKELGVRNVAGLVALAKSKPGGLSYGSTGIGSAGHFIAELFRKRTGIENSVHVPFRGAAPLAQELLGGRIDFAMASVASIMAQVEAGSLTALATMSDTRSPNFPQVPTAAELGISGVSADAWFALFAPANTAQAVVDLLQQAVQKALTDAEVKQRIIAQGVLPEVRPGADLAKELPDEIARWAAVAKDAGMAKQQQ